MKDFEAFPEQQLNCCYPLSSTVYASLNPFYSFTGVLSFFLLFSYLFSSTLHSLGKYAFGQNENIFVVYFGLLSSNFGIV